VTANDLPNFRIAADVSEFDVQPVATQDHSQSATGNTSKKQTQNSQNAGHSQNGADSQAVKFPELIENFLVYFHRQFRDQNIEEIHSLYETTFNKLSEKLYKTAPWPAPAIIAHLVKNDEVFLQFYGELYFRHLYTKLTPTLQNRIDSWNNYTKLFSFLLQEEKKEEVVIPTAWLWDMLDEFVFQYHSFCQFRNKLDTKDELRNNKSNPWNTLSVFQHLHAFVRKASAIKVRETEGEEGWDNIHKQLGVFSQITLLRLNVLLGDYHQALKAISTIDLNNKGLYTRVTGCHITLYYYLGFAYLMTRRYVDSIRTFSNILIYISRTKQYHTRSYQYEQILKKNEQMYSLLAIGMAICPQRLEDNVHAELRLKNAEKINRLQRGDEATYREMFCGACPRFVSLGHFPDPSPSGINTETQHQLTFFLEEVKQQSILPTVRSYLKLYMTISISKLAKFLEKDEATLRTHLVCVKHKTRALIWNGGPVSLGQWASSSDVDFYIDQDMIHIGIPKVTRRYGEYFLKQIQKLEEIIADI
jgi:translation initiation factor 3 subunit L